MKVLAGSLARSGQKSRLPTLRLPMSRASFIAALAFAAALARPGGAAADDCICGWPMALEGVELDEAQIEAMQLDAMQLDAMQLPPGQLDASQIEAMQLDALDLPALRPGQQAQSIEVGPFFSSDGTMLMSRVRLEHSEARGWRVAPPTPSDDVLWCASADDPRCSPAAPAPEDGPQGTRANPFGASHGERPSLPPPAARTAGSPAEASGPREGVRFELERPPRR